MTLVYDVDVCEYRWQKKLTNFEWKLADMMLKNPEKIGLELQVLYFW